MRQRTTMGLLCLLTVSGMLQPATAAPSQQLLRPVMVAGNGDFDTCLSTSFVTGIQPGRHLTVRAGPHMRARPIGYLDPDTVVWACDMAGGWVGIVYNPANQSGTDVVCDLGPSETPRRPYRGPCRAGWVHQRFLLSYAG